MGSISAAWRLGSTAPSKKGSRVGDTLSTLTRESNPRPTAPIAMSLATTLTGWSLFHLQSQIVEVVVDFVATILGKEFVENPSVTLASLYADMNHLTPLVFVLSAGSDPMGALMRFAHEMDYIDKLEAISLGQGQSMPRYCFSLKQLLKKLK